MRCKSWAHTCSAAFQVVEAVGHEAAFVAWAHVDHRRSNQIGWSCPSAKMDSLTGLHQAKMGSHLGSRKRLVVACAPMLAPALGTDLDSLLQRSCSVDSHHGSALAHACIHYVEEGTPAEVACHGGQEDSHRKTPRCSKTRQTVLAWTLVECDGSNDVCEKLVVAVAPLAPRLCERSAAL